MASMVGVLGLWLYSGFEPENLAVAKGFPGGD